MNWTNNWLIYLDLSGLDLYISGTGADPGIYFGGGQTKVPNPKLRAKPESRARSARVSRAKPESRARSARELRAKPEPRAKPEKKRGEGSGEGARWAPPQKIFEKSNLKPFILVHIWSNYLKRLTKWFNCHFHEKSLVIWCDGKSGGRVWGGGLVSPSQKIFEKSNLKPFILVHIRSNYLKWLTKLFNCHFHEKLFVIIWCDGIIKFCWSIKFDRGSGGRSPPEAKTF